MSEAAEVNTIPVELDSLTKESEDLLYPETKEAAPIVEEVESEKKTLVSEDPIEDEVAKTKEDKSDDAPEKLEEDVDGEVSYTLKLSEESHLDKSTLEEIKSFAKENKLSNEAAQSMLKREEDAVSNFVKGSQDALEAQVEQWRGDVEADKVLGRENFEQTKLNARKAVQSFGSEEFINILNTSGYGNNPEVVSFLAKIGSLMSSDSLVVGSQPKQDKADHEYFYK